LLCLHRVADFLHLLLLLLLLMVPLLLLYVTCFGLLVAQQA
jgi:hypothetical protein